MENHVNKLNEIEFFELIKKNKYDELKELFQAEKSTPWLLKDEEGFTGK